MTRPAPDLAIAAWPALLTTDLACAYTCLGADSFRFLAKRAGVEPVDCGGLSVTRWRKADLDHLIDSLPRRGAEMAPEPANAPDPAQAALERARKRARG